MLANDESSGKQPRSTNRLSEPWKSKHAIKFRSTIGHQQHSPFRCSDHVYFAVNIEPLRLLQNFLVFELSGFFFFGGGLGGVSLVVHTFKQCFYTVGRSLTCIVPYDVSACGSFRVQTRFIRFKNGCCGKETC